MVYVSRAFGLQRCWGLFFFVVFFSKWSKYYKRTECIPRGIGPERTVVIGGGVGWG